MLISRKNKNCDDSLSAMAKKDKFLLTVSVNLQDLAEFSVATDVLGQRTNTAFVYQFMMQKVREAKSEISESKFLELVEAKKKEILDRSERKAKERKFSFTAGTKVEPSEQIKDGIELATHSKKKIPHDPGVKESKRKVG